MSNEIILNSQRCASGKQYLPGKPYKVPKDISRADANILVKMRVADWVEKEKPKRKTQAEIDAGKDDLQKWIDLENEIVDMDADDFKEFIHESAKDLEADAPDDIVELIQEKWGENFPDEECPVKGK